MLVLVILPGLLLYPCLSFYLFEPDEGRYAQIPREMLLGGDWIVPTLQGEPYLDKPPLFYWLVMGSYAIFGCHDWAARLVPALAVHGTILAAYFFGRRMVGERAAFFGTLVLIMAPGFAGMGRLLLLDGLLTLWVTLALGSAFLAMHSAKLQKGWWLAAALACGLGVLTKGPVALALVVPPLWLHQRLTQRGTWPSWRGWLVFAAVVLAVNVPWYGAVCVRAPEFARHFFWQHNVVRFLQPFDHERPVWFYAPIFLAGWLSGTLLLVPFWRFLNGREQATHRPPEMGLLLLAGGWCLLFFSLAGCKLPTYILPAFPPLSLAVGCMLARTEGNAFGWTKAVLLGCFFLMMGSHYLVVPMVARQRSPMNENVRELAAAPELPVFCFPRNIDSAAFYLGRADCKSYRSKQVGLLVEELRKCPRALVLFGHRHSLDLLRAHLPERLKVVRHGPMGLCEWGLIERCGGRFETGPNGIAVRHTDRFQTGPHD